MDAQWSDDFHHALFTVLHVDESGAGYYDDFGSMQKLAKSLTHIFVYDGDYSGYRLRRHGRPVDGLSAHHFIAFIQNHDQIGNRASGERIEHIVGLARAKVAIGLVLTAPFIPMLFQGEEYAASTPFLYFADHEDPEMARLVSEGRKREFAAFGFGDQVPDPEARDTFTRSKLNWEEIEQGSHSEMLDWVRALIHLRRTTPALNDGDKGHIKVRWSEEENWLVMDRGAIKVVLNLGTTEARFDLPVEFHLKLASLEGASAVDGKLRVPPDTIAIVSSGPEDTQLR
jgi:maltooligosyltrehalose trehalohydrolase